MGFMAVVLALLIEHVRPLRRGNAIQSLVERFAASVRKGLDGGERGQGALGWALVMLGSLALVLLAQWIAESVHPVFVFALHVFVLYCTIGFRQFSQAFAEIRVALAADDAGGARRVLDAWSGEEGADAGLVFAVPLGETDSETCRRAIEHALLVAHRQVLGPLFCYIVIPGAAGPVLYRVAALLARRWASRPPSGWGDFAGLAFGAIDWVPARLTAAGFAIVGNFEDAVYCWRGATSGGAGDARSVLLAAGGGALRVRLADPELESRWAGGPRAFDYRAAPADPAKLDAAAGLVWRSLVLWLGLFALITVSAWMGR